jgi:hypothetical protein
VFKGIALFGTGLFIVVLIFSAVSVYLLDEFDPNLGRGISFQILSWIAALLGIVGALGFASGMKIFRAVPRAGLAGAIGVVAGIATLIVMMLGGRAVGTVGGRQIIAIISVFGVSLLGNLCTGHRE